MRTVTDLSLLRGALPWALAVAGILGGAWLLLRRDRRFLRRGLPFAVAASLVSVGAGYVAIEEVWRPFPDPLPWEVYLYSGLGVLGLLLAWPRSRAARTWPRRAVTLLAVLLVLVAAGEQVNLMFRAFPTVGEALGLGRPAEVPFGDLRTPRDGTLDAVPLQPSWTPPPGLPAGGRISQVTIPATVSGFSARPGWVYLPPAYFAPERPLLPVLVLLSGQPGSTQDWLNGGQLVSRMDSWAAEHGGLSPVVVMADATGGPFANPLCLNSDIAQVQTYLALDVPAWIRTNLQVRDESRYWAVGGFSYGGTCALQLGTNRPDVYPTFLDISGQDEPTLGTRAGTVAAAFGGDASRYVAVNPIDLLGSRDYSGSAAVIVTGSADTTYLPQGRRVFEAAQRSGMDVRYLELDGGHDYGVWGQGLSANLDWLGTRLGITG